MQATRFGSLISLALLCVAGVIAIVMALRLGLWRDGSPGPGLFPFLASAGIVLLSGIGIIAAVLRPDAPADQPAVAISMQGIRRIAVYMAALIGYAFLLEPLGFYATTALALFVILKLAEGLRWRIVAPLILGALLFTHLLFERALGVYFPKGNLWDFFL